MARNIDVLMREKIFQSSKSKSFLSMPVSQIKDELLGWVTERANAVWKEIDSNYEIVISQQTDSFRVKTNLDAIQEIHLKCKIYYWYNGRRVLIDPEFTQLLRGSKR